MDFSRTKKKRNFKNIYDKFVSPYLFIAPYLIFFLVFSLLPVVMSLVLSFMRWDTISDPVWVGLKNYQTIFDASTLTGEKFWKSVGHTCLFVIIQMPILIIIPFLIAFLLNAKLKGFKFYRALIYFPAILSVSTVGLIFVVLLDTNLGVINKIIGQEIPWLTKMPYQWIAIFLLSTWWGIGGNMTLFTAGLQDIPKELYEAAEVDGCNSFQKLIHITIPGLKNTFTYVLTMTTLSCFNVMGQPMMLTPGEEETEVAIYYIYSTAFGGYKFGRASAMAIILALIMSVFSLITLKRAIGSNLKNEQR